IWIYQPIKTEIAIGINAFRFKMASISPIFGAILTVFCNALIHPIPYKTALYLSVATNQIPIFLKISGAVTHGVRVFTPYKRAFCVGANPTINNPINVGIHVSYNIGMAFYNVRVFFSTFI